MSIQGSCTKCPRRSLRASGMEQNDGHPVTVIKIDKRSLMFFSALFFLISIRSSAKRRENVEGVRTCNEVSWLYGGEAVWFGLAVHRRSSVGVFTKSYFARQFMQGPVDSLAPTSRDQRWTQVKRAQVTPSGRRRATVMTTTTTRASSALPPRSRSSPLPPSAKWSQSPGRVAIYSCIRCARWTEEEHHDP